MGVSYSAKLHEKIERNRREGRDCRCGGGRLGCSTRATRKVHKRSWVYNIGEGKVTERVMTMCTRHANATPAKGVNFETVKIEKY